MVDHKESVMLALLPITTHWCKIECPHMTLVYVGEIKDLKPTTFNELAKDAAALAMITHTIQLKVLGTEVFGGGEEDKVDVLRLQPTPELLAMRRFVESWNASQHPFRPHATIGPASALPPFPSEFPSYLAFNRIMVGWGDESLTFWLNR